MSGKKANANVLKQKNLPSPTKRNLTESEKVLVGCYSTQVKEIKPLKKSLEEQNKEITSIIKNRKKIEENFKNLETRISKVEAENSNLKTENLNLKNEISALNPGNNDMQSDNLNLQNSNKILNNEVLSQKKEIRKLSFNLEDLEQKFANDKIIITCNSLDNNKSLLENLSSKLKLSSKELDGLVIEKFGNLQNKFLVKIPKTSTKSIIFVAAKKEKPRDLYVNEFLVKRREKLLYDLRMLKRNEGRFVSVYTFNGDIYVKYNHTDMPFLIKSLDDVMDPNAPVYDNGPN